MKFNNAPVLSDTILYITGDVGANGIAKLFAIHKNTGKLLWIKDLTEDANELTYTTPLIYKNNSGG